jgi:hypothetical protein
MRVTASAKALVRQMQQLAKLKMKKYVKHQATLESLNPKRS